MKMMAPSHVSEQKRIAFVRTLEDPSPSVVQAHKDICREVQAELRKMQDNWWRNKADELQDLADRHDSRFYEELKLCLVHAHRQPHHFEAKMILLFSLTEIQ